MATIAERIKEALDLRDMRQNDLAKATGIGKSSISTYLSGEYMPKQKNIYKMSKALQVSPEWLMGVDVPIDSDLSKDNVNVSNAITIPILNTVVAGLPLSAYSDAEIIGYEEVSRKLGSPDELFCLQVVGDSMLPVLQEGDIIVVKKQADVESGDIAIVLINGDEATVKKVMKSPEGITLIAFNPAVYEPHFYPNDEIEVLSVRIAGKVIEMKRSF